MIVFSIVGSFLSRFFKQIVNANPLTLLSLFFGVVLIYIVLTLFNNYQTLKKDYHELLESRQVYLSANEDLQKANEQFSMTIKNLQQTVENLNNQIIAERQRQTQNRQIIDNLNKKTQELLNELKNSSENSSFNENLNEENSVRDIESPLYNFEEALNSLYDNQLECLRLVTSGESSVFEKCNL